jgi:metallo-beta-lactamase class B
MEAAMISLAFQLLKMAGVAGLAGLGAAALAEQTSLRTPEAHRAAARAAAEEQFQGLYRRVCVEPETPAAAPARGSASPQRGQTPPAAGRQTPPRDEWHADPVKVFDNFYFLGTKVHGAWAVTTSDGIIVIDALYDYAVIDEVEGGLKKLGLDPANVKYLIVTHGHGDHHGGTKYLQDKYRPRVVMGAADWDLVERDTRNPKPARDIAAADGQKITLGDTTVTLYVTPGHTPTTISLIVPVKDGARSHVAAEWGGTAFSASTPLDMLKAYINSAVRFREIAARSGADVIFTNHTDFDGTNRKLAALSTRKAGTPHPFVVGKQAVSQYLTVAEECAKAALAAR